MKDKDYHVVICFTCSGTGGCSVPDYETPGSKDCLPGMIFKYEICKRCNGIGYVKIDIDKLKEI